MTASPAASGDEEGARSLRVAYLSASPRIATGDGAAVTGPRAHILGLVGALREHGHEVRCYVLGDRVEAALGAERPARLVGGSRLRQLAVDVVRVGLRVRTAWEARRVVPGPVDVAYERYALFQEVGRSFQRRGACWVVESNALLSEEARLERGALVLQRLAGRLERRTYRRADLVVVVSEALRRTLVERAGVDAGKVLVVPNGVDTRRFDGDAALSAGSAGGDALVVGFVGFVVERQGLEELLRAVAQVRSGGRDVRVVVVGDGPALPQVRRLATELDLDASVELLGQVPWSDVPGQIARFSVGYSGQRGVAGMAMYHSPLKIYEYLAMGRPVLASRHPDAEQVVQTTGAGWLFSPGDVDDLARALSDAARADPDELTAAGRRGRAHVLSDHSWRHRARQITGELERRGLLR